MAGNLKDRIGTTKIPMHMFPVSAIALGSIGMLNGALKYGRNNFRAEPIKASIYVAAALRHLHAWFEGEEVDPDDGVPHLGAALANLAILADAQAQGTLVDDRNFGDPARHRQFMQALTPLVARLTQQHACQTPEHYTLQSPTARPDSPDDMQGLV